MSICSEECKSQVSAMVHINKDTAQAVCDLVKGNRHITVAEIISEVGISVESVHRILFYELEFSKVDPTSSY